MLVLSHKNTSTYESALYLLAGARDPGERSFWAELWMMNPLRPSTFSLFSYKYLLEINMRRTTLINTSTFSLEASTISSIL